MLARVSSEQRDYVKLGKKGNIIVPSRQAAISESLPHILSIDASPTLPTAALNSEKQYHFDFEPSEIQKIDSMSLRFDITEASASEMVLVDTARFVASLEWQSALNNDSRYMKTYGDVLFWEACVLVDQSKQSRGYLRDLNVSEKYGEGKVHTRSKQLTYRVALPGHPFEHMRYFAASHKGKMRLVINTRAGGIVVSGSGTVQLDNVALEIVQHRLPPQDIQFHHSRVASIHRHRFLEPQQISLVSKTLTVNTAFNIDLDTLTGKYTHFLLAIRADGFAATSGGLNKFLDLGDDAKVDLLNASGQSIFGAPTQLSLYKHLVYNHHFDAERFGSHRNFYVIPFVSNIRRAYNGELLGGVLTLDGTKIKLSITPGTAGTACVQAVNCNNPANDGGFYKLMYRGEMTGSLAYNADATAIKAALEGLSTFKNYPGGPLTVTASGALTADMTFTFPSTVDPPQQPEDLIQVVCESLNDGGVAEYTTTSIQTYGRKGFSTGSTYSIDLYAFKCVELYATNGEFRTADTK